MKALKRKMNKEQFHLLDIPEDFAEEVEIIILPSKPAKIYPYLSEEEQFYIANNDQIIEDDKNEDELWSKYL